MITAKELLEQVDPHDQKILELMEKRYEGFTLVQISKQLKRSRLDVKHSLHRLAIAKKIHKPDSYGRVRKTGFNISTNN